MRDRAKTHESPADRYVHHADQAARHLAAIRASIDADIARIERRKLETGRSIDWADVGSMEEVARKLAEVAEFLGSK